MDALESARFTVAVFQDAAWAGKGLDALAQVGFPPEALTVVAKDGPDAAGLFERIFKAPGDRLELPAVGTVLVRGGLVPALDGGSHDLAKVGLAGTMRRVGFQAHDGRIFEALAAKGGVLVAIQSESRAADALAILHSYGGGNAAIGAWTGRV